MLAERFEAAEEEVLGGCVTEILGVFLASWSLEKERTEKGASAGEFLAYFDSYFSHLFLILVCSALLINLCWVIRTEFC